MRKFVSVMALLAIVSAMTAGPAATAPSDPYLSKQWGLQKIRAPEAWPIADGTGVLIAIVDTGVDLAHPDLAGKIVSHPDADFVEPEGSCKKSGSDEGCTDDGPQDRNGHGTHVAGIAAAVTGNGIGVAGTAPGGQLLPVRVLDGNGESNTADVAAGIRYAADKGAAVINLSLSYRLEDGQRAKLAGDLTQVYDALEYAASKGAVTVIAAGNNSAPLCAEPSAAPRVMCVGATDQRDLRSLYSNGDATQMKNYLVAPGGDGLTCGGDIFSTYLRGAETTCSSDSGYDALFGTSMATPFVAGVAALLSGKGLSSGAIVDCLKKTSTDLGAPGRDPVFGYGRVNAYRAVTNC